MEIVTSVKDVIENYGIKSEFASFLPGIAGLHGIPMWCYTVNRGQAVVSFGVQDKDHGIMEFYPAHTAYQMVGRTGFRTFIKADGKYFEPFKNPASKTKMTVYMNSLTIEDEDVENQIKVKVSYSTLPGEKIASLMRVVEITNLADKKRDFEILDGMPALVPFGVGQESLKMMAQTTKAWMQVEDVESKVPYYRVRVSMEDSAVVKKVEGGNFAMGKRADGSLLPVIVDPRVVFEYDLAFEQAVGFKNSDLEKLVCGSQNTSNELPCAFFGESKSLAGGETITLYEMIGQVRNKDILMDFLGNKIDGNYFEGKFAEATKLADELTESVASHTADKIFDNYVRYNYMDNLLRGGTPIQLGGKHTYYVYSRKHGDLERDYNYFSMSPEFYSQGNGNFRDVNQNRRCDTFFSPIVKSKNIEMFYSLIQLDGYNPLKIEQMRYVSEKAKDLGLIEPFTPGTLAAAIMDKADGQFKEEQQQLFDQIMADAKDIVNADFGEGYWSDHWTYNLDLIEDFLEIYPDEEKKLLFETKVKAFDAKEKVRNRFERYEKTDAGVRQYYYLEKRTNTTEDPSYAFDTQGNEVTMSLMAKLILMSTIKLATLDAYGLGVEMEGGKPGWYDALNGLPGLLGSSMNETYELARMIEFVSNELCKYGQSITLPEEVATLVLQIYKVEQEVEDSMEKWNRKNDIKEDYRKAVYDGFSGKTNEMSANFINEVFAAFKNTMDAAVEKAVELGNGIAPAYFTYEIDDYEMKEAGIVPKHFSLVQVPYFLEGPVRFLKLGSDINTKKEMYSKVKASDLYDEKLSMYKVNASLQDASFELGRCRAFTPGWLENESIWLHMEYKYLLELLRSGLYEEFFDDFKKAAVPFLERDVYGRSTLENSSFIASSKNPNERIHGKGFVARLSGSTIEFISMWKLMFFGKNIFTLDEKGQLCFNVAPAIPKYLIDKCDDKYQVSATLLGSTKLTYCFDKYQDYMPENYRIESYHVELKDGTVADIEGEKIAGELAEKIRDRCAISITIKMTPK
ncbi:hypothetical protein SAMN04487830_10591 [Pseudobutyrivibrio sp. OR37]|uniref:hypothetical protein n=1 Tax=Pseudobutyrivibrio sp. OR37 TaxID=1798186 RepID=UPI0008EA6860|nr:hypothetical protein [Pseudobutyrivibrio sp. OR37]SFH69345.1 hypothetical protein SAMN04487830_10591 [Pseudobutyrivibrio sp. OR37]